MLHQPSCPSRTTTLSVKQSWLMTIQFHVPVLDKHHRIGSEIRMNTAHQECGAGTCTAKSVVVFLLLYNLYILNVPKEVANS